MDASKIAAIKKHIGMAIQNEEEARDLIKELSRENWTWWLENTHPMSRWQEKPCVICKKMTKDAGGPVSGMCGKCQEIHRGKTVVFSAQRSRAKKAGLPYTLTLREWYETVDDFQWKCAYCLTREYKCIEHFLPIELGGGTTKDNCVPACQRCNNLKKGKHPSEVSSISQEDMVRVQSYLSQFSS